MELLNENDQFSNRFDPGRSYGKENKAKKWKENAIYVV